MDEGDYRVNEDGFLEEKPDSEEDSEAEDEIEEIDEMETTEIDANAEFDQEAELKKLDKQLASLRRRDKALDMSRMEVVKTVKRRAPYDAMQEEGYNAKKGVRNNDKGRNVDIAEEERLANEMKKRMAKRQKQDDNKAKSLAKKF